MKTGTMDKPLIVHLNKPHRAVCPECSEGFDQSRTDQVFCHPEHKRKFHRRREARAVSLYDQAVEWRRKRAKGGFTKFCQILDDHLSEDKARIKAYEKAHKDILIARKRAAAEAKQKATK